MTDADLPDAELRLRIGGWGQSEAGNKERVEDYTQSVNSALVYGNIFLNGKTYSVSPRAGTSRVVGCGCCSPWFSSSSSSITN